MYSELADIENRLPFDLNSNSKPTSSQVTGIREQANMFLNAYLGRDEDMSGNTSGLRVVETDLAVNYCMWWHMGSMPAFEFTNAHKVILDNNTKDQMIDSVEMEWDNY